MKLLTNIFIILLVATTVTSCASSGSKGSRTAYLEVNSAGTIRIGGKPVSIDRIGRTLKRKGFGLKSPVKVYVPSSISPHILKTITISLTNSGFHRVLFIKPKQSAANVVEPNKGRK